MAGFELIEEGKAPAQPPKNVPAKLLERKREYEDYINQLPPSGKVGVLQPGEGETPRGISLRVSRAANRLGVDVQTYIVDGKVYFHRVTQESSAPKRKQKSSKESEPAKNRTVERVHRDEKEPEKVAS